MKALLAMLLLAAPLFAAAQQAPRIAVTDLAYEEQVARYFQYTRFKGKTSHRASERYADSDYSSRASARSSGSAEVDYESFSGDIVYIERGELRKFTADIKGEMLKSGVYRVVQAKPYTAKENEKLYDVIDRIKKGYFPNADYVLFGSITSIEPRRELNPVQGSNATSASLSMELVAEFSLINTRTYEVKAAFSAMGEGQDMRLLNSPGQVAHLSQGKVMREVAQSLGVDAASQLEEQFSPGAGRRAASTRYREEVQIERREDRVIEYR